VLNDNTPGLKNYALIVYITAIQNANCNGSSATRPPFYSTFTVCSKDYATTRYSLYDMIS